MANGFFFDDMTQADATAFVSGDALFFRAAVARDVQVSFTESTPTTGASVALRVGAKTLTFSASAINGASAVSLADASQLAFNVTAAYTGSAKGDQVYGGLGLDTDGADLINGADGDDLIQGNNGADTVYGATGDDFIYGGRSGAARGR